MPIYAALGVPEVWRFDGERLVCHVLGPQGYEAREFSLSFPFLRVGDVTPFLLQLFDTDDASLVQTFQTWLRTQVLPRPGTGPVAPEQP